MLHLFRKTVGFELRPRGVLSCVLYGISSVVVAYIRQTSTVVFAVVLRSESKLTALRLFPRRSPSVP